MRAQGLLVALWISVARASSNHRDAAKQEATGRLRATAAKLLGELGAAKQLAERVLEGHPEVLGEEERLLSGAEAAARRAGGDVAPRGVQLVQQSVGGGAGKAVMLGALGVAERAAKNELRGHPQIIEEEKRAMHLAETPAKRLTLLPKRVSIHQVLKEESGSQTDVLQHQEQHANLTMLQEQQHSAMLAATREEQSYAAAEEALVKDSKRVISALSEVKGAIAHAFAGKDSKAVETAMEVGELLDEASAKQADITKLSAAEAAKTREEAHVHAAQLAQVAARSKALQASCLIERATSSRKSRIMMRRRRQMLRACFVTASMPRCVPLVRRILRRPAAWCLRTPLCSSRQLTQHRQRKLHTQRACRRGLLAGDTC